MIMKNLTIIILISKEFKKKEDFFLPHKNFLIEKRNKFKQTKFYNYDLDKLSKKVYVEGHFECEKYFEKYKDDLKNEFNILDPLNIKITNIIMIFCLIIK